MSRDNEVSTLGSGDSGFGEQTASYNPGLLEAFENRHTEVDEWVRLICPEFTSLCPKTGQPDWATLYINYIPDRLCVESKSIKLYLNSFRNHGDFHEDVVCIILKDIKELLKPRFLEVHGIFNPRGGIAICPYASSAMPDYVNLRKQRMSAFPTVPDRHLELR